MTTPLSSWEGVKGLTAELYSGLKNLDGNKLSKVADNALKGVVETKANRIAQAWVAVAAEAEAAAVESGRSVMRNVFSGVAEVAVARQAANQHMGRIFGGAVASAHQSGSLVGQATHLGIAMAWESGVAANAVQNIFGDHLPAALAEVAQLSIESAAKTARNLRIGAALLATATVVATGVYFAAQAMNKTSQEETISAPVIDPAVARLAQGESILARVQTVVQEFINQIVTQIQEVVSYIYGKGEQGIQAGSQLFHLNHTIVVGDDGHVTRG